MERYTSTKAQIWSIDFVIGIVIFLGAILLFYKYSLSSLDFQSEDINDLLLDAKLISNYLVSSGYPDNWTIDDVTLIGLTDGNLKIIDSKIVNFKNLTTDNYTETRKLLSTRQNFYVFFQNRSNDTVTISGVSEIGKNYSAEDPKSIIKITRLVNYNSTIIKMVLYVW